MKSLSIPRVVPRGMGRRSAPGARATSSARAGTSGRAPETDPGTRPAVAREPESDGWMPRKKRPSARASREWRDAGDALRTNRALAKELRVSTPERARDVLTAAVLCESLAVGPGEADVRSAVTRVRDAFPSGAVSLRGISVARASKRHRYLVADAPGAVFVACAGTQDARDLVTDASVRAADLELAAESNTALGGSRRARLFAHGGFASRARSLRAQIRALFRNAVIRDGKRLVLCGHSLGGAVAALAMLGLLLDIEDDAEGAEGVGDASGGGKKKIARRALAARFAADGVLCCVGFAAPPPGDEATRLYAEKMGWTRAFVNICSREDFVPRLMLDRNANASKRDAEATPASENDENREIAFARKRVFPMNGSALSWRPTYAHVSPVHMVARDGAVTVVDARDVVKHAGRAETKEKEKEKEKENAERESAFLGVGFFGLGASAKKVRDALAEHTMRAHRARLLVTCATALAEDENMTRRKHGWFNWLKWGFGPNRGVDAGFFFSSTGRNPSATLRLPPPAGAALFSAPQPRPSTANATVDVDGESRPSLLVTVTGLDLELCESVAAETNGWPCGATLVATNEVSPPFSIFQPGGAVRTLNVRVYPPTLNGALVPSPLFGGGGDAKDWSRVVVALRGDFGDARVAVRVEDAETGFAETPRSRL